MVSKILTSDIKNILAFAFACVVNLAIKQKCKGRIKHTNKKLKGFALCFLKFNKILK